MDLIEARQINRGERSPAAAFAILLVENNPGDVRLTMEALRDAKVLNHMSVAADGVEAMAFLRRDPAGPEHAQERRARGPGRDQGRPRSAADPGGDPDHVHG
jgi:CheY-like chemotaxis protein